MLFALIQTITIHEDAPSPRSWSSLVTFHPLTLLYGKTRIKGAIRALTGVFPLTHSLYSWSRKHFLQEQGMDES